MVSVEVAVVSAVVVVPGAWVAAVSVTGAASVAEAGDDATENYQKSCQFCVECFRNQKFALIDCA